MRSRALVLGLLGLLWSCAAAAAEANGTSVALAQPARRIVSLAPHLTELLYAAGAGDRVVGAVSYSDFPPAARSLPQVGDYGSVDLERIVALKPDLIVAWRSGNSSAQLKALERLGFPVFRSEQRALEDIPRTLEQLGELAGSAEVAKAAATTWRRRLARLRQRYAQATPLSVFYEVWHQPLMTVNGKHLISAAIDLCGGRNVFATLPALAPQISVEAVLAADPQVIVASGMDSARPEWLDEWRVWPQLDAVRHDHLYFVPPDLLQRPGPRFIDGAEQLCQALDRARGH